MYRDFGMLIRLISFFYFFICCFIGLAGCAARMIENHSTQEFTVTLPINEESTQKELMVQGSIPTWLEGTFVRNEPVSVEINHKKQAHWFDGLAMLHAFSFQQGRVQYSNKFLRTDAYKTVFIKGSIDFLGFDSITPHPILDRLKSFFQFNTYAVLQNADVTVAKVAEQYIALTETPLPVRFDLKTVDTLGALEFQDRLPKRNIFDSAHIRTDGQTGEQFNYLVDFGLNTKYIVYRYHPNIPCRETIGKIPVKNPAYMHSFAITQNYIILVEFPLVVNPISLLFMTKPFIRNYYWDCKRGTNFLIIDRKTGKLLKKIKYPDAFFAFHHVNAYEADNNIILDIVMYPNADIVGDIAQHGFLSNHFSNQENLPLPNLRRYTVSISDGCIQSKLLSDLPLELPRINEKYTAHKYRYVYGSDQRLLSKPPDIRTIYKIDLRKRRNPHLDRTWRFARRSPFCTKSKLEPRR